MSDYILPNLLKARKRTRDILDTIEYEFNEALTNKYLGMTYYLKTYGCQANEADSEFMRYALEKMGFKRVETYEEANFIMFNTCAIRETAEDKIFGELGRLNKYKRKNPNMKVAISGCMPQEEATVNLVMKKYPQVNLVIGTHNIYKLPSYVDNLFNKQKRIIEVLSEPGKIIENLPKKRVFKHKAFVSIMEGCDEFCSYCIVPYTRGEERSRAPKSIIKECKDLINEGYLEITLIGQNVDSYGLDFKNIKYDFADLLKDIAELGIKRLRFMTSYPRDISLDTIKIMAKYPNIMPHIHLPMQAGSNKVLKMMNRHYTIEEYLEKVKLLKKYISSIAITTDIICAFPGEERADFEETLKVCKEVSFDGAFTFIYSKREGTPATKFKDQVEENEKKLRLKKLNEVVNEGFRLGNFRFLNKEVSVLVDGISKKDPHILYGYSEHNKIVNFAGTSDLVGTIVKVKITKARTFMLMGELIKD